MPKVPVVSGGSPDTGDYAPCGIYIFLYAVCLGLTVKRLFNKSERWITIHQRGIQFPMERIALFAMRIACANNRSLMENVVYLAAIDGMALAAWYSLVHGLIDLMRYHYGRSTFLPKKQLEAKFGLYSLPHLYGLLALPMPIVSSFLLQKTKDDPSKTTIVTVLRYVPTAMIISLLALTGYLTWNIYKTAQRPEPRASRYLLSMIALLSIVPIYRICTFHQKTDSMSETSPASTRALFYVLQCIPEYIVVMSFSVLDMKKMFGGRGRGSAKPGRPEDTYLDEDIEETTANEVESTTTLASTPAEDNNTTKNKPAAV